MCFDETSDFIACCSSINHLTRYVMYILMKCSCWMMHYNLSRSHRVKLTSPSPGSTVQTGLLLHSRQLVCGCVFMCVCDHTCVASWLPQSHLPSILITPSLAFVHVSPSPVCDLLPCYTTWQIDECSCDSLVASNTSSAAHTHTAAHYKISLSHRAYICSPLVCLCSNSLTLKCSRQFLKMHWGC